MSQYETEIRYKKKLLIVRIGWDPPLTTYFGQVIDETKDDEDRMLVWVGTMPLGLLEIDHLRKAMPVYTHPFIEQHNVDLYRDKDEGL